VGGVGERKRAVYKCKKRMMWGVLGVMKGVETIKSRQSFVYWQVSLLYECYVNVIGVKVFL
jgi:hypothetical protein